jgi:hypothetical protein
VQLAIERTLILEAVAMHDLHRSVGAQRVSGQPNLTVAAAPNAAEQRVIGNQRRNFTTLSSGESGDWKKLFA